MPADTYTQRQARFAHDLDFGDIPPEVVAKEKIHVLDSIGVAYASLGLDYAEAIRGMVSDWGGKKASVVWGSEDVLPETSAAMVNASLIHGHDFDDTHTRSIIHVSATAVPTSFAVGEAVGASGKEVLAASILSVEIATRVGLVAPGRFHERGYHPTGLCGIFGATVAAAKLYHLSEQEMANALGIAGSQASAIQEFLNVGGWVKRFHPGWASHAAIVAAQMSGRGFTGPMTVYEGKFGFFRTHLGDTEVDFPQLVNRLGEKWEFLETSLKPYPCCNFNQAFMDSALQIKEDKNIESSDVEEIECMIHPLEAELVCEPRGAKMAPKTEYDAKFSLAYSIGLIIDKGRATINEFLPQNLGDKEVLSLARKVKYRHYNDPNFPEYFPGWVVIKTKDGSKYEYRMEKHRGSPALPMSRSQVEAKFRDNVREHIPSEQADEIIRAVDRLDVYRDIREFTSLLRKTRKGVPDRERRVR